MYYVHLYSEMFSNQNNSFSLCKSKKRNVGKQENVCKSCTNNRKNTANVEKCLTNVPFSSSIRSVHSSKNANPAMSMSDTKLLSSMNLQHLKIHPLENEEVRAFEERSAEKDRCKPIYLMNIWVLTSIL